MRPSQALLAPGTVIDHLYEIVRPIGRGGMATVYAARQLDGAGTVAVKVISVDREDSAGIERRFFRELVLATRIRHPNIVTVHDFGVVRATRTPYLVMEQLRGTTLHRALREHGPIDEDRATRLFVGALGALAEAHTRGVVHRDLKPSNLFLCTDGGEERLVVLDFGIAHQMEDRLEGIAGTPRYAAPEYILRNEVRPTLDVYQMGLVLAEALSGRPVVAASRAAECFRAHVHGPLALPPEADGGALGETIRRAIHPDPSRRYPRAGDLLEALTVVSSRSSTWLPSAVSFGLDVDDPTGPSVSSVSPAHDLLPEPVRPRGRGVLQSMLAALFALVLLAFAGGLVAASLLVH